MMALSLGQMLGLGGNPIYDAISPYKNTIANAGLGLMSGKNWTQGFQNAAAGAVQGNQIDDQRQAQLDDEQKNQAQLNQTIEWMRTEGFDDLVQAAESGVPIGDLYSEAWKRKYGNGEGFTLSPGQTRHAAGGEVIASGPAPVPDPKDQLALDKENFDRESALWKEYMAAEPVKTYQGIRNGYEKIRSSATLGDQRPNDSGAADISLIFAYMKMLDPGSVVREGEFATAEQAGGVSNSVLNLYNKVVNGGRLTTELRAEFVAAADAIYAEASQNVQGINDIFDDRSEAWGVDPTRIIQAPETYPPLKAPSYPGVTITRLP
jgi:hypothetical protein